MRRLIIVIGLLFISSVVWSQAGKGRLYPDEMYRVNDYIAAGTYICSTGDEWTFTSTKLKIGNFDFDIYLSDYDPTTRLLEIHRPELHGEDGDFAPEYIEWFYFYYEDNKLYLVPYASSWFAEYDELLFAGQLWLRRIK